MTSPPVMESIQGEPSELAQNTLRHQILSTNEIYYPGGYGGRGGGQGLSLKWVKAGSRQQVFLQEWASRRKEGKSLPG